MSFPFPIFSSTLLFERGTLITSGIFSSNRPRRGLSLSVRSISMIFSVQKFNNSATSKFMLAFPASEPRKGYKLFPSLKTHFDILPVLWASHSLLLEPNYDVSHAPPQISGCRTFVFYQASCHIGGYDVLILESEWIDKP